MQEVHFRSGWHIIQFGKSSEHFLHFPSKAYSVNLHYCYSANIRQAKAFW